MIFRLKKKEFIYSILFWLFIVGCIIASLVITNKFYSGYFCGMYVVLINGFVFGVIKTTWDPPIERIKEGENK